LNAAVLPRLKRAAPNMPRLIENFDRYVTTEPSMRKIPLHVNPPLLKFQRPHEFAAYF
jgi:hypothetical protein